MQSLRGAFLELSDALGKLTERRQVLQALPGNIDEVRTPVQEGAHQWDTDQEELFRADRFMQQLKERREQREREAREKKDGDENNEEERGKNAREGPDKEGPER